MWFSYDLKHSAVTQYLVLFAYMLKQSLTDVVFNRLLVLRAAAINRISITTWEEILVVLKPHSAF